MGSSCGLPIHFSFSSKPHSDSPQPNSRAASLNLSNCDFLFFIMTYIAFIDESGDHGMKKIDPESPHFALTAAVYTKEEYIMREVPAMIRLKMGFWGHEGVIFHDYDIKKKNGPFKILIDNAEKIRFWDALSVHFQNTTATLISAVIDKQAHANQYRDPANPYQLCVQFVLERIQMMTKAPTTIVFESRGKSEDKKVRAWAEATIVSRKCDFDVYFAKKQSKVAGLQIADLACQPIILSLIHISEPTRPY